MSRWARWAMVATLSSIALVAAGCGGDDGDRVVTAPSSTETTTPSTSSPVTVGASTSTTFGPGPIVPGSGQSWADLYPDGQPPVFPLPNSSRAFPAAQAAALGFAREFMGMDEPELTVEQQSDAAAELVVHPAGSDATSRLTLRRDELGWVIVRVAGDGIPTGLPAPTADGEPTEVPQTIVLSSTANEPGTMVDVVDLADGRVIARQPATTTTVRLPDPAPQLAAVVVYVPTGDTAGVAAQLSTPRRARAASVAAVHILPN